MYRFLRVFDKLKATAWLFFFIINCSKQLRDNTRNYEIFLQDLFASM
jgi:hypothetical protein